MLRRSRSTRAARQDTGPMEEVQSADTKEESQTVTQISSEESDIDFLVGSGPIPHAVAPPGKVPVTGESFCQCELQEELGPGNRVTGDCFCGEEDQAFDWVWDKQFKSSGVFLSCDDRKASFHSDYSCGTAAVRGNRELQDGQHYWEVKMTSPVYGTDMMVGIGTSEVNLDTFQYSFGSLLGHDDNSWGLSYSGLLQHNGDKVKFSSRFGQGSIIGVHLDTWHGTLTFYKNRHCLGVAAARLQSKKFFPMVCSTAAKSSMKVIRACYTPTSLQYLCCARLRHMLPPCADAAEALDAPPGLRALLRGRLGWVFALSGRQDPSEEEEMAVERSVPSSPSPLSPALSACASPELFLDTDRCPRHAQTQSTECCCPPTPPSSDYDSCCSEPEEYQCKRCRWT